MFTMKNMETALLHLYPFRQLTFQSMNQKRTYEMQRDLSRVQVGPWHI